MSIAILSDIHGNMDALEAVLQDMDSRRPSAVYCLGDTIGYGAEPERVVACLHGRRIPTTLGNHELPVLHAGHLKRFNPVARTSIERTLTMISAESAARIRLWPAFIIADGCRFVHGFPPDRIRTYLFQIREKGLIRTFERVSERLCFVGHTHELELIAYDGRGIERRRLKAGLFSLDPDSRYLINIGSVGQPRDGTHHAKYALWHPEDARLEIRFVPYDVEAAAAKIIAAGLPESHASRLR